MSTGFADNRIRKRQVDRNVSYDLFLHPMTEATKAKAKLCKVHRYWYSSPGHTEPPGSADSRNFRQTE